MKKVVQDLTSGGDFRFTLPAATAKAVDTLSMDGSVEIVRDRKKAVFSDSNFEVKSRLIAEPFLDYGKVVAQRNEGTRIALDRKELLGVLGRVKLARSADAKEKSVLVMDLEPGGTGRASINDTIRGATREMGDQADIQQKILQGAQDCREEYGVMAGDVTKLVQLNSKLFPVDDAVKFVSLVEKLEKGSGREANLDNTMSVLQKAMSSDKLDKSGFSNLKTAAPEVVKAISSAMGVSEKQLQNLAESGKLSAKQLKEAFFAAESDIQKNFDELGFGIGDALTYVRNQWGLWLAGADDMLSITTSIGKAIKTISDFLMGKAQRLISWLKNIAEKLGGVEQLLKLIVMVATALFLATNGSKILSFLAGAVKLLQGFNLQTALAAAKWLLLFLVLEDVFTFLQGGDSVFGRLLSEAGVDVDALREKISAFFEGAKQFGRDALDSLGRFWEEHKGSILVVLQALWQGLVDLTADIITLGGHLLDLLAGLITGFQTGDWTQFLTGCKELWQDFLDILNGLGRAAFGETWKPLKESAQAIWDWLKGFFDWFGDKITWAKNLWNGVKNFFTGGNGDDPDDSDEGNGSDKNSSGSRGVGGGKSSGGSGRTSNGKSPTGAQASSGGAAASRNAASAFISGGKAGIYNNGIAAANRANY